MKNLLLLEDDETIGMGLKYALTEEGYNVEHCSSVGDFKRMQHRTAFSIALLDICLPDGTGFDVAKLLSCPFIFLTATDDEANTVRGFDIGADDYINKPFRLRELLARIKAVLRRNSGEKNDILTLSDITINKTTAKVTKNNEIIDLTTLEYRLLLAFAENKGVVLSRAQLLDALWDKDGNFVEDNTLTVCVKRLREKLNEVDHKSARGMQKSSDFCGDGIIETVRGIGYVVH